MQEAFEKNIYDEVLEKAWQPLGTFDEHSPLVIKVSDVKEIIRQMAAGYKEQYILDYMDKRNQYAESIISELRAIRDNGWIPCNERLPDVRQVCLVTVKYNGFMGMYGFWIKTGHMENKNDWLGDCVGGEVIAWQPLPEPYQPKGEWKRNRGNHRGRGLKRKD